MLVFDKAYIEVRNRYILPLTNYSVPYKNLKTTNIKSIIGEKFKSVDDLGNGSYLLYFDNEILIKALIGDIELFYIRTILQKEDVEAVNGINITANWNIVTNYYHLFFCASLLLRLCHRGNLFLDSDLQKTLQTLISQVLGFPIKLDNNLLYEIQIYNGEYVMKLSPSTGKTHEFVWKMIDELINEFILLSTPKSEEYTVLKSIKNINNKLNNTYPSQLRNKVNYQPLYGIEYLDKRLFPINTSASWLNEIMSFDISEVIGNDNRIANICSAYGKFIEIFSSKLIFDYFDIKGNQNGILKKINDGRTKKVSIIDYPYAFNI